MGFRDQGIEPARGFKGDGFTVRPLTPSDVVLDYDALRGLDDVDSRLF